MRTIKIGVIGAGGISNAHMGGYRNTSGVEVIAVADIVPGKAKAWAERYGVKYYYEDYKELLSMDEIEAVSVCTYNKAHKQPTVDALKAGKNVLVEKPMSDSLKDAYQMLKAAQGSKKILMCGIHSRYSSTVRAAKKIVESGELGEIYYAESSGTRRRGIPGGTFIQKETAGGGAVVDIGVYDLDTALYIMGHPKPISVSAITADYIGKGSVPPSGASWRWDPQKLSVEEFGAAWVRFESGAAMTFKISWAVHINSLGRTYFLGKKGGLALSPLEVYKDMNGYMVDIAPKELPREEDRFRAEIGDFVRVVRENLPSPIPPEEVIWTNVIMDGIYRSAAAKKEVKVGLPTK